MVELWMQVPSTIRDWSEELDTARFPAQAETIYMYGRGGM